MSSDAYWWWSPLFLLLLMCFIALLASATSATSFWSWFFSFPGLFFTNFHPNFANQRITSFNSWLYRIMRVHRQPLLIHYTHKYVHHTDLLDIFSHDSAYSWRRLHWSFVCELNATCLQKEVPCMSPSSTAPWTQNEVVQKPGRDQTKERHKSRRNYKRHEQEQCAWE